MIRAGRYAHLRRPIRTSATTDTYIRVGRCVCSYRSLCMSAPFGADDFPYIFLTSSIIVFFMFSHDSSHNILGIGCISASS